MKRILIIASLTVLVVVLVFFVLLPSLCADKREANLLLPFVVEIETPGGPLPFILRIRGELQKRAEFQILELAATPEEWSRIEIEDDVYRIGLPHYDSWIELKGDRGAEDLKLVGTWKKRRGDEYAELPISSSHRFWGFDDYLFETIEDASEPSTFSGRWSVDFESFEDLAIGVFEVDDNQIATGTFLTTTGDYRYLAGRVDGDLMRLSAFDGAHAFLFHARMLDDGTIEGDCWSGNWHHETWTAVRDDDAQLPDAFIETTITDESKLDEMVFRDLAGVPTRVLDLLDESDARARVIEVFGTWCPNCADAGRELVDLKSKYADDLAVVGLAFEITEDFDRSVTQVRHYEERMGSDWPILIAGLSDKSRASEALPVLDRVRSYPTLIFLNERNEVEAVYTGFSGPATGDAYIEQRERFEGLIEQLISE